MPVATVNENHCTEAGEDEIRTAWQMSAVESITKPQFVKGISKQEFRFGVL